MPLVRSFSTEPCVCKNYSQKRRPRQHFPFPRRPHQRPPDPPLARRRGLAQDGGGLLHRLTRRVGPHQLRQVHTRHRHRGAVEGPEQEVRGE